MAGRAAHGFAGARIRLLPGTGHLAHMDHPAQVAAEVRTLLGNSRSPRPVDREAERDARAPVR